MIGGWPFVVAAYAVGVLSSLALTVWSMVSLRRAERRADALRDR